MKVKFNRKIASSLFVGIYTDTGRFQHNNTHKQTLEIASRLLSFGVDIAKISKLIYHDKSINQLKLWGLILSRIKYYHQLGMVVSYVSKKDLIDFDIGREALEGISNFLATIPDAKVAMLLQEEDNVIKGSLRTEHNQYDVSKIASAFGGGGHKRAAGFEIPKKNHQNSNLLEMIDLAKIKKYLLT